MYECPGCGANLKFDIVSQQMICAYCGLKADPYSLQKDKDAEQEDTFEATKFTCPQCGGEMISGDQDVTAFCSFCGAANILTSRLTQEKRPGYIIPFKKTKEDCKAAYARKLKRAFFAPRELRDPAYIDSFRGIYMPYWTYQLKQQGGVCFQGSTSYRRGDYIYTKHFNLTGNVDAAYYGFSYDASSAFYDNISEALAPYYVTDQVAFTPAYLSGFYADTADVEQEVYLQDAQMLADECSWAEICEEKAFKKYGIESSKNRNNLTDRLHTQCTAFHSTMYPVWFLSWRKDDRVAYATVNGQTGKVVADLPIDIKQFLKGALVLAIPLFVLLNFLGTMKPHTLLNLCCLLGLVTAGIYLLELRAIRRKESNEEDLALQIKLAEKKWREHLRQGEAVRNDEQSRTAAEALQANGGNEEIIENEESQAEEMKRRRYELAAMVRKEKSQKKQGRGSRQIGNLLMIIIDLMVFVLVSPFLFLLIKGKASVFWPLIATIAGVVLCCLGYRAEKKLAGYRHCYGSLVTTAVLAVSLAICFVHPVSDLWYYLGAVLIMLAVLYNIWDILRNYNRMAMRRLPQFDKQGGDDHA